MNDVKARNAPCDSRPDAGVGRNAGDEDTGEDEGACTGCKDGDAKPVTGDWIASLKFDGEGLIPAIIQDAANSQVLMVAYMNPESLQKTLLTRKTHFWSRSRQELWLKGETSGHYQFVKEVRFDCDQDTLLIKVDQVGPACHTGHRSCFYRSLPPASLKTGADSEAGASAPLKAGGPAEEGRSAILQEVYEVIQDRKRNRPAGSYTASLLAAGKDRILKKVAEEAGEVIIASKNDNRKEIVWELADLWFHTLLLMGFHDIPPEAVYRELAQRSSHEGQYG